MWKKVQLLFPIVVIIVLVGFAYFHKTSTLNKLQTGSLIEINGGYDPGKKSRGKILAIDEVDEQKIYGIKLEPIGEPTFTEDQDGNKINISAIGHLPISERTLRSWQFKIIGYEDVREEELEGYKMWKEASGGAF